MPSSGVPAKVAVPSPLSMKVTSSGNGPVSDRATSPSPFWSFPGVVVTVNEPACPTVKVVLSAEVIVGGSKSSAACCARAWAPAWAGPSNTAAPTIDSAHNAGTVTANSARARPLHRCLLTASSPALRPRIRASRSLRVTGYASTRWGDNGRSYHFADNSAVTALSEQDAGRLLEGVARIAEPLTLESLREESILVVHSLIPSVSASWNEISCGREPSTP